MGTNILYRLGGVPGPSLGGGVGRVFLLGRPLQLAQAHAPEVDYSIKAFVLVPFAAVFGVFFLIFGDSVEYRNVEKQTPTAAGWVLAILCLAAGGLSFWW